VLSTSGSGFWGLAQAFRLAGVSKKWGAPSFAFCAKGGYHGRLQ
jgi:hypothetical protein